MSRPTNYKKKFILTLEELYKNYPNYSIAMHISTAVAEYGDFWGVTDKELCFALEKYAAELELDHNNVASPDYVDAILEDGKHLFENKPEEEDEEF